MKANRKFIKGEEAVSAVIGVILMVAITVAIAATVYVYVSGMLPAGSSSVPSIAIVQLEAAGAGNVTFVIDSASNDAKWSDLKIYVNNTQFAGPIAWPGGAATDNTAYYTGAGTPIKANDRLVCFSTVDADGNCVSGNDFVIVHVASNSRLVTKTIY